jgi:RNA polymerase sigma factor, sigma-70 family
MELEKIVNKYTNYLYTTVTNMSYGNLSSEDIEEIISDVFFIFWKNKEKFDTSKKLNLYLAGIAKNLIKSKYRKIHINSNIEDYESILIDNYDISYNYEQIEKTRIIEDSLNCMQKEDKDMFVLYYYFSKSIKEIANELNCSEFKIKSKLFRIRKKIKTNLERGGYRYE